MIRRKTILLLMAIVLLISTAYTVFDNQRFVVIEQDVTVKGLPAAFDGFRILQISDLHGSFYGIHQAELIEGINRLDYDLVAFTGDMNASTEDDSLESSTEILDLLRGITNKDLVVWVDGNAGPHAVQTKDGVPTGHLTEIGRVLQENGCIILMTPYPVTRGEDKIWITPEMSEIAFQGTEAMFANERWLAANGSADEARSFLEELYESFQKMKGNEEVKILITHAPKQTNITDIERERMGELDYDLILAGHYHGGQLRLPLLGAVYIPSPTIGINNSGFFPAQQAVAGISYYGSVPQYVSAGLGASGHVWWLNFRLFNTPEINLITVRAE